MFEEPSRGSEEPRKSQLPTKWPLRLIAIFAGAILLGFGLCGLDARYFPPQPAQEFGPNGLVGGIGAWIVVLGALGLAGSVLALIVVLVANAMGRNSAGR